MGIYDGYGAAVVELNKQHKWLKTNMLRSFISLLDSLELDDETKKPSEPMATYDSVCTAIKSIIKEWQMDDGEVHPTSYESYDKFREDTLQWDRLNYSE